jgi:hypothetical protein
MAVHDGSGGVDGEWGSLDMHSLHIEGEGEGGEGEGEGTREAAVEQEESEGVRVPEGRCPVLPLTWPALWSLVVRAMVGSSRPSKAPLAVASRSPRTWFPLHPRPPFPPRQQVWTWRVR